MRSIIHWTVSVGLEVCWASDVLCEFMLLSQNISSYLGLNKGLYSHWISNFYLGTRLDMLWLPTIVYQGIINSNRYSLRTYIFWFIVSGEKSVHNYLRVYFAASNLLFNFFDRSSCISRKRWFNFLGDDVKKLRRHNWSPLCHWNCRTVGRSSVMMLKYLPSLINNQRPEIVQRMITE